ncbi:MAG: hypothetical protein ACT4OO_16425 [Nitrospiraceae bacterium]
MAPAKQSAFLGTLLAVVLFALVSWASSSSDQIQPLPHLKLDQPAVLFPQKELLTRLLPDFVKSTTFRTTSFALPPSPRLKDLRPDSDGPRTEGFLSSSSLLKGTFIGEGEVSRNTDAVDPVKGTDDPTKRMTRFSLTGTSGVVRYGVNYRSAGKAFWNAPDQAMRELWSEWAVGVTKFRSSLGETWNNVDGEITRSRIGHTQGRVALAIARPSWPEVHFTYAHSLLSSSLDPAGIQAQRSRANMVEGALVYGGQIWNARLASGYVISSDQMRAGAETLAYVQTFTGTYRPLHTLTIVPTIGYRTDQQQWSGVRIDNPTAILSINYKQSQRFHLSALGGYVSSRSSDGLVDTESVNSKGVLTWTVRPSSPESIRVSLEAGYTRLANRATPTLDSEDLSGLIRLRLSSF